MPSLNILPFRLQESGSQCLLYQKASHELDTRVVPGLQPPACGSALINQRQQKAQQPEFNKFIYLLAKKTIRTPH